MEKQLLGEVRERGIRAIFGVTERALVLKSGDLLLPDFLGWPVSHQYKEGLD